VFRLNSSSLSLGVVFSEGVDSNILSHVELVADGGSSGVEPVGVVGTKLFGTRGLGVGSPL
jgi:hypothetical protein